MHGQNEVRKDFTTSERVAIAETMRAEIGSRQGKRTDKQQLPLNGAEVPAGKETRDIVAERAGFDSHSEYERAKAVVEKGTPELIAAMDSGEVRGP